MALRFAPGKPALVLRDALVIADLHIGIEQELQRTGVRLPPATKGMLREVLSLLEETGAKKKTQGALEGVRDDMKAGAERVKERLSGSK